MKWTWPCWRLVADNKVTWTEVNTNLSINDVMKLYDAINLLNPPPPKK